MKILVFTTLYPNSLQPNHGIFVEKRLLELTERYSIAATVCAPVPWLPNWLSKRFDGPSYAQIPKVESRNGLTIYHPRFPVIPKLSWRIAPILIFLSSFLTVRRLNREAKFDLIDGHFAFPDGVAALLLGETVHLPTFITARGSDLNDSPKYFIPRMLLKFALRRAAGVIAVSRALAEIAISLGADVATTQIVPNGVDAKIFAPSDRDLARNELKVKSKMILSVGSLRELKGHHIIIRALAQTKALAEYQLLIVGGGGMETELKALVRQLDLEHRVRFEGLVSNEQLPKYYNAASIFVLASSMEGCPNVVLEALACGTPVVASAVGAIPDMLPPELLPFLVAERTPGNFGAAIADCLAAQVSSVQLVLHANTMDWESTSAGVYKMLSSRTN